jgi:hypothetical protein
MLLLGEWILAFENLFLYGLIETNRLCPFRVQLRGNDQHIFSVALNDLIAHLKTLAIKRKTLVLYRTDRTLSSDQAALFWIILFCDPGNYPLIHFHPRLTASFSLKKDSKIGRVTLLFHFYVK